MYRPVERNILAFFLLLSLLNSCSQNKPEFNLSIKVAEYCSVYQERVAFDQFIAFYDDAIVLEDIINGDRIIGKENLRSFFNWDNPDYHKLDSLSFETEEIILSDRQVVIRGHFNPFEWGRVRFESMHFVSILEFNDAGKIIKQQDWINYPSSLIDYRKNSNKWIKEK